MSTKKSYILNKQTAQNGFFEERTRSEKGVNFWTGFSVFRDSNHVFYFATLCGSTGSDGGSVDPRFQFSGGRGRGGGYKVTSFLTGVDKKRTSRGEGGSNTCRHADS